MEDNYEAFIASKARAHVPAGFDADCSDFDLFQFQCATVEWALKLGRAAIFADTGLGKTFMQLAWAHKVTEQTGRPVLILAPLAVVRQTEREAEKFGIPCVYRLDSDAGLVTTGAAVYVLNYDMMHKVDPSWFSGVVLDESSILKNYSGMFRRRLQHDWRNTQYKLACTATPAPNDFLELGTHSEFLDVLSSHQMISRWFITDQREFGKYRLKGHAVRPFWRWVTSWARCIGKPSDMGDYSDEGYDLPPLNIIRHNVGVDITEDRQDGRLFRMPELSATSIHSEKRRTAADRAAALAAVVMAEPDEHWTVWCETNYEQDELFKVLPGCIDVRGAQSPEKKAEGLLRFADDGGVLVTKPKIAGMGLNYQHCARVAFVGGSYSYEAFYQAVRRSYRFGQTRPVDCHVFMAATETVMWNVINRKAADHEAMKAQMFATSRLAAARSAALIEYHPAHDGRVPAWLKSL